MSTIDDLISELCPDGVEYKSLGGANGICDVLPSGVDKVVNENERRVKLCNYMDVYNNQYITDSLIPGFMDGSVNDSEYQKFVLRKGQVLLTKDSETKEDIAQTAYVGGNFDNVVCGYHIAVLTPKSGIEGKFLNYVLQSPNLRAYFSRMANGVSRHGLKLKNIEDAQIPMPPLPIQEKIVYILDKFKNLESELEAKLEAELKARKKQHEDYSNSLFVFPNRTDIKYMSVGELFEFKNGLNKGKEYFGEGTSIVNFTDVFKNRYLTADNLKGRVNVTSKEIGLYNAHKGDVFFTRTSETQEEIGMVSVLVDDVESCVFSGFVLRARPTTALLLPKYCSFCFSSYSIRKEIIKNSTYTTRALTSGTKLSKLFIPVPPIEEQRRIIAILDRFDALVNDISLSLPAEIAARRKQYEYYRNKLLTFKEKTF